jgi:hypothetical protein
LDDDVDHIRVVRYSAAILKIRAVDESGTELKEPSIFATFATEKDATDMMMTGKRIGFNREGALQRLSSIVPNVEFSIRVRHAGFEEKTQKLSLEEGERRTITVTLNRKAEQNTAN